MEKKKKRKVKSVRKKPAVNPVPILPKPLPSVSLRQRHRSGLTVPSRSHGACGVPGCLLLECSLQSHRYYALSRTFKSKRSLSTPTELSNDGPAHYLTEIGQLHASQVEHHSIAIMAGGVDGLPALPLDELQQPVYRALFHEFFSYRYERTRRILSPPAISDFQKQFAAERKDLTLSLALSVPVYCCHFISAVHYHSIMKTSSLGLDRTAVFLHNKMLSTLREKLDNYNISDAEEILMVILTLVLYETALGKIETLSMHRKAMTRLVTAYGGIHKMPRAMFVFVLDRTLAFFLCQPPVFPPTIERTFRRPFRYTNAYGRFFDDKISVANLDSEIVQYCENVCRCIEMLEVMKWSFHTTNQTPEIPADVHYFYYLREELAIRFTRLNAGTAESTCISVIMLLSARIAEYIVLHDEYLASIPIHLANRVRKMIDAHDNLSLLKRHPRMCRWILFILTSISNPWAGRPWALKVLKKQIDLEHSTRGWPPNWSDIELENVRAFIWSDTRLRTGFDKTCSQLSSKVNILLAAP